MHPSHCVLDVYWMCGFIDLRSQYKLVQQHDGHKKQDMLNNSVVDINESFDASVLEQFDRPLPAAACL